MRETILITALLVVIATMFGGCATTRYVLLDQPQIPKEARMFLELNEMIVLTNALDIGIEEYAFARLNGLHDSDAREAAINAVNAEVEQQYGVTPLALADILFAKGAEIAASSADPDVAKYINQDLQRLRRLLLRLFVDYVPLSEVFWMDPPSVEDIMFDAVTDVYWTNPPIPALKVITTDPPTLIWMKPPAVPSVYPVIF